MTGSRGRWPIWGTRYPIKRLAIFCSATHCRRHPSASTRPHGGHLFGPIWRYLAGTDFFTAEVFTLRGLVTYYVLFFIHLESRRVDIAGITVHPDERWMKQMARNATMEGCGALLVPLSLARS